MANITFILGGSRSGKSTLASNLAKKHKKVVFFATSEALDDEMKRRISLHKRRRPKNWKTIEASDNLAESIGSIRGDFDCAIIDCITLYIANLCCKNIKAELIEKAIKKIMVALRRSLIGEWIVVSNEVGQGIVPVSRMGREFRDIAGKINQIIAKEADTVLFMIAGIPQKVK